MFSFLRRGWSGLYRAVLGPAATRSLPPQVYAGPVIPWGGCEIPDRMPEFGPSSLIIGSPGAGKSLILRMALWALLRVSNGRPWRRFLMLDEKRDAVSIVGGLGVLPNHRVIANPFDARCAKWDMAIDISTPAAARQMSSLLVPNQNNVQNPFFDEAARSLLTGAIQALCVTRPGVWELLDVVRAMRSPKRLRPLLSKTEMGQDLIATYLNLDARTAANVMATIDARLAPFGEVASLWARTERRFSLTHWASATEPYGIILGADDTHAASLRPLTQLIFRRAAELVVGRPEEHPEDETVFVLDELTAAGRLDSLKNLCEKGRSKGVRTIAAFQDFDSFCSVYGSEAEGRAIAGMFHNLALLRMTGTGSMRWASELLGRYSARRVSTSTNFDANGFESGSSVQVGEEIRSIMEGAEFRQLPLAGKDRGITGVFATPGLGFWRGTIPPVFINKWLRSKSDEPGFIPRSHDDELPPPELVGPEEPVLPTGHVGHLLPDMAEVARELVESRQPRRIRTMEDCDE